MLIFWQIFLSNIILVFVLITVHEIGHWVMGMLAGIPRKNMKIRLLTFPQQVVLHDGQDWVSVSDFDRYHSVLNKFVPSKQGKFLYVVGGFLFETLFLIVISLLLWNYGYWLYASVASGLSLVMYFVYLFAMDIPQSKALQKPWGDTTILLSLAKRLTLFIVTGIIVIRVGLVALVLFLNP